MHGDGDDCARVMYWGNIMVCQAGEYRWVSIHGGVCEKDDQCGIRTRALSDQCLKLAP